jgi:hypothetical protein
MIDPTKAKDVVETLAAAADVDAGPTDEQRSGDFTTVDHLAMADCQLDDVRAQFAVPPREC